MNDVKPKLTYKEYVVLVARAKKQTQEQIAKQENVTRWAIRKRIERIRKKGINPEWL